MDAIELFPSPVKTMRIPVAPGTPTHARSPSKPHQSPSKRLGALVSEKAWDPVDLESIFFSSPEKSDSRTLEEKLGAASGQLCQEEMGMTVELWIRSRALQGQTRLKNECERLVGVFEKEGGRAMETLKSVRTAP